MGVDILSPDLSKEALDVLRNAAREAVRHTRHFQARRLSRRQHIVRQIAGATGALALLFFLLSAGRAPLFLAALPVAGLLAFHARSLGDRATDLVRDSLFDDSKEDADFAWRQGRALSRGGQALLDPPGSGPLALIQTPSGLAAAIDGSAHDRLAQVDALSGLDADFWNAHLSDIESARAGPWFSDPDNARTGPWPSILLRDERALVLMFGTLLRDDHGQRQISAATPQPLAVRLLS